MRIKKFLVTHRRTWRVDKKQKKGGVSFYSDRHYESDLLLPSLFFLFPLSSNHPTPPFHPLLRSFSYSSYLDIFQGHGIVQVFNDNLCVSFVALRLALALVAVLVSGSAASLRVVAVVAVVALKLVMGPTIVWGRC